MARHFVSSDFLGSEKQTYIKIQDKDYEMVIDPKKNSLVDKIKKNFINLGRIPEENFEIKIFNGAKVIGPFPTCTANKIIRKINGMVHKKNLS